MCEILQLNIPIIPIVDTKILYTVLSTEQNWIAKYVRDDAVDFKFKCKIRI